jgi:hypothetical protein
VKYYAHHLPASIFFHVSEPSCVKLSLRPQNFFPPVKYYAHHLTAPIFFSTPTVKRSGLLFEAFVMTSAPRRIYDVVTAASRGLADDQSLPRACRKEVWSKMRCQWYGWMITSLASFSDAGKTQMMHLTQFVKFLGLSRMGQDVLQRLGWLNTLRYCDMRMDDSLTMYQQQLRCDLKYYWQAMHGNIISHSFSTVSLSHPGPCVREIM